MEQKGMDKLCPFKKQTLREDQREMRSETITREKFEYCAGEKCMAYYRPRGGRGVCLRLVRMEMIPGE